MMQSWNSAPQRGEGTDWRQPDPNTMQYLTGCKPPSTETRAWNPCRSYPRGTPSAGVITGAHASSSPRALVQRVRGGVSVIFIPDPSAFRIRLLRVHLLRFKKYIISTAKGKIAKVGSSTSFFRHRQIAARD
jgi:hypothetical protein